MMIRLKEILTGVAKEISYMGVLVAILLIVTTIL